MYIFDVIYKLLVFYLTKILENEMETNHTIKITEKYVYRYLTVEKIK
jgi:hypothetical protein